MTREQAIERCKELIDLSYTKIIQNKPYQSMCYNHKLEELKQHFGIRASELVN